ncbi:MAG: hydroxyacid dehydrogenase [Planctomycetes bacterium]|nr:hydroxyacid dehydrogenase [Planctomycetota bacterium]
MDISGCKVFIPNPIHQAAVNLLKKEAGVVLWDDPAVEKWREEADAIILRTTPARKADLVLAKRLKVIGKHGIGVDNIDVADAKAAGIKVVYTPHENIESVAELAVAFMLSLSRNLFNGHLALREGRKLPFPDLVGIELAGKTLGIVGLGRIGQRVGKILTAAFGMQAFGFDPFLPAAAWGNLPFATKKCDRIEELIDSSAYVTIHVPLTEQTRDLVGAAQLAHCRPEAILINTARGGIINEAALFEALKAKKLRAAASDVFVMEPPGKEHPLLSLDNFWAMPHVGANTADALYRMGTTVAADILRVLKNEDAKYYVP